jgi:hypothetical protein
MSLTLTVEEFDKQLDLMDELEEAASLEAAILDLQTTMESILSIEGVSKSLIEPYQEYLTNVGGIKGFTKTLTKVNYDYALEALEDHTQTIIGGLIVVVAAIIAKIVSWLIDLFLNRSKGSDKVEKAVDNVKVIEDSTETVVNAAPNDLKDSIKQKLEFLKEGHQKRLDDVMTEFSESVMNKTCLFSMLSNAVSLMKTEMEGVYKTIDEFIKVANKAKNSGFKDKGQQPESFKMLSEFAALTIEPTYPAMDKIFKSLGYGDDVKNIKSILEKAEEEYKRVNANKVSVVDIDSYVKNVTTNKWKSFDFSAAAEVKALNKLDKRVKTLNSYSETPFRSPDLQAAAKEALNSIRNRVIAIQKYFALLDKAFQAEAKIMSIVSQYTNAKFNAISTIVTNSKDEDSNKVLDKEKKNIKEKVKKL